MDPIYIIILAFSFTVVISVFVFVKRESNDYAQFLKRELRKYDLKFVSSKNPGLLKLGPFAIIEHYTYICPTKGRHIHPKKGIIGFGGEYRQYRIIICKDKNKQEYQLWALLEFEGFVLRRIRWRIDETSNCPKELERVVEEKVVLDRASRTKWEVKKM